MIKFVIFTQIQFEPQFCLVRFDMVIHMQIMYHSLFHLKIFQIDQVKKCKNNSKHSNENGSNGNNNLDSNNNNIGSYS